MTACHQIFLHIVCKKEGLFGHFPKQGKMFQQGNKDIHVSAPNGVIVPSRTDGGYCSMKDLRDCLFDLLEKNVGQSNSHQITWLSTPKRGMRFGGEHRACLHILYIVPWSLEDFGNNEKSPNTRTHLV